MGIFKLLKEIPLLALLAIFFSYMRCIKSHKYRTIAAVTEPRTWLYHWETHTWICWGFFYFSQAYNFCCEATGGKEWKGNISTF